MNAGIILVLCALVALVCFALMAWKSRRQRSTDLCEIDLVAFENLISADEEEFLRAHLSAGEFRTIQRERLRAAMEYVSGISHNAGVLLQMGSAALHGPDPKIAEAGRQVIDEAGKLRLNAQLVRMRLLAAMLWPGARHRPAGVLELYRQLKRTAEILQDAPAQVAQAV
jgi:hypothetical protein